MGQVSEIEWTDATWNPVTGCTKIGPGCANCYAERFAERWRGIEGHPYEQGYTLGSPDEAVIYVLQNRENWTAARGALQWLAETVQTLPPPDEKRP